MPIAHCIRRLRPTLRSFLAGICTGFSKAVFDAIFRKKHRMSMDAIVSVARWAGRHERFAKRPVASADNFNQLGGRVALMGS